MAFLIGHLHKKDENAPNMDRAGSSSKPVYLDTSYKGYVINCRQEAVDSFPEPNHNLGEAVAAARKWISRRGGTCLKKPKMVQLPRPKKRKRDRQAA